MVSIPTIIPILGLNGDGFLDLICRGRGGGDDGGVGGFGFLPLFSLPNWDVVGLLVEEAKRKEKFVVIIKRKTNREERREDNRWLRTLPISLSFSLSGCLPEMMTINL